MLFLTRFTKEKVIITVDNKRIEVLVKYIKGNNVRLGFKAPENVSIHREEIQERIDQELDNQLKEALNEAFI